MALTATLLSSNWGGFAGDHRLYRLSAPLPDPNRGTVHEFVVVFAVNTTGTPETIIVPAREDGSAVVMNRLPGTVVGVADHAGALWVAGGFAHGEPYSVVVPEPAEAPVAEFETPEGDRPSEDVAPPESSSE